MSTEQPQKSRLWKRRKLPDKFVTIIIKFTLKFTNGSILLSTISAELQPNGTLKYVRIFS